MQCLQFGGFVRMDGSNATKRNAIEICLQHNTYRIVLEGASLLSNQTENRINSILNSISNRPFSYFFLSFAHSSFLFGCYNMYARTHVRTHQIQKEQGLENDDDDGNSDWRIFSLERAAAAATTTIASQTACVRIFLVDEQEQNE